MSAPTLAPAPLAPPQPQPQPPHALHPTAVPQVLAAVLLALAGARTGDRVAAVGAGELVERSLLAASTTDLLVESGANVVVAGAAFEVPTALTRLRPTGRLVAVAADRAAAERVAAAAGLRLRHVEAVLGRVAWSATRKNGQAVDDQAQSNGTVQPNA